jgi:hypothetical protein
LCTAVPLPPGTYPLAVNNNNNNNNNKISKKQESKDGEGKTKADQNGWISLGRLRPN